MVNNIYIGYQIGTVKMGLLIEYQIGTGARTKVW